MKKTNLIIAGLSLIGLLSCQNEDIESQLGPEKGDVAKNLKANRSSSNNEVCVTKSYDYTHIDKNTFSVMAPDRVGIWPGNIVSAKSVEKGVPISLGINEKFRTPISVGFSGINGSATFKDVPAPSRKTVLNDINTVFNEVVTSGGVTNGSYDFQIEEVVSAETTSLAINAGYAGESVDVSGSLNLDFSNNKNKVIVKLRQVFYTVELGDNKKGLLGKNGWYNPKEVTKKDFQGVVSDFTKSNSNPALVINSVSYGRFILLVYESTKSSEDIKAALNFEYKGVGKATADAKAEYTKTLSSTTLSAHVLGGDPGTGFNTAVNSNDIIKILEGFESTAKPSIQNPGTILSYTVREAGNGGFYAHTYDNLTGTYQSCIPLATDKIVVEPVEVFSEFSIIPSIGTKLKSQGYKLSGIVRVDNYDVENNIWNKSIAELRWGDVVGEQVNISASKGFADGRELVFDVAKRKGAKFRLIGNLSLCKGCGLGSLNKDSTFTYEYYPSEDVWKLSDGDSIGESISKKEGIAFVNRVNVTSISKELSFYNTVFNVYKRN